MLDNYIRSESFLFLRGFHLAHSQPRSCGHFNGSPVINVRLSFFFGLSNMIPWKMYPKETGYHQPKKVILYIHEWTLVVTVRTDFGLLTSTITRCVLTYIDLFNLCHLFFLLLWLSQTTATTRSVFKLPRGEENISAWEDASMPTPVDFSQSTSRVGGGKRGANGGEEAGWDTYRSRFRCLNLWHGHLVGFDLFTWEQSRGKTSPNSSETPESRSLAD